MSDADKLIQNKRADEFMNNDVIVLRDAYIAMQSQLAAANRALFQAQEAAKHQGERADAAVKALEDARGPWADVVSYIVRDICELDVPPSNHPRSVTVDIDDVTAILHAAAPVPAQPAAPVAPATVAVPDDIEAIAVCLEDDAAILRNDDGHDEISDNMNAAAAIIRTLAATQPQAAQAAPVDAVALAYGILWHANNMRPGYDAPAGHERLTPEKAAYKARHVLRDLLTRDQLGDGINRASDMLAASQRAGGEK